MQTSHKIKLKMAEGCQLPAVWWSAIKKFNFEICILEPEDVSLENCAIHIYKPCCKGQTITCTYANTCITPNIITLHQQKVTLTNQAMPVWLLAFPKSLVAPPN